MATYVTLYQWTDEGIKNVRGTVDRVEQVTQAMEQAGGTVHGVYWTQGRYDLIAISEWPDEEAAMAMALRLATAGNVRSETLRAFGKDEMRRILGKLG